MVKENYITIPQLAKLLGKSRIAVYKDVRKGKIPAVKIGRNYVISDRDIACVLGRKLSSKSQGQIDAAVKRIVREYGEVLKRLCRA